METETKEKMKSVNIRIPETLHIKLMILAKTGGDNSTIRSVMIKACEEYAERLLADIDLDAIFKQIKERQYGYEGERVNMLEEDTGFSGEE